MKLSEVIKSFKIDVDVNLVVHVPGCIKPLRGNIKDEDIIAYSNYDVTGMAPVLNSFDITLIRGVNTEKVIMRYYDVHVDVYSGSGYSIFYRGANLEEDNIVSILCKKGLFKEEGDELHIDYIDEISEADYNDAIGLCGMANNSNGLNVNVIYQSHVDGDIFRIPVNSETDEFISGRINYFLDDMTLTIYTTCIAAITDVDVNLSIINLVLDLVYRNRNNIGINDMR